MPTYDYVCVNGHVCELRRGYNDEVISCPECGNVSIRSAIYYDQSIVTETGMKQKAKVPFEERYLKPEYELFREAASEADYQCKRLEDTMGYDRSRGQSIDPPLWKEARRKATRLHAAGVSADEFRRVKTS